MAFFEAGLGGTNGFQFRIRVNSDIIATDEENNRTLIRYNAYVDRVIGGNRVWDLTNRAYGHTNLDDYGNPYRGNFNYDTTGAGRAITMAANEDRWYGHDGNGNRSIYQGADVDMVNGPYLTTGATGGWVGLPSYYRYADPTGVYVTGSTDVSLTIRVTTNRLVDAIAISLTGGGNWYYFYGSGYDYTMTVGSPSAPLQAGTTFPLRVSLKRQSSQYWKEWGNIDVSTATSNNFFDVGDM